MKKTITIEISEYKKGDVVTLKSCYDAEKTITKIIEKCGDCPNFELGFLSEPSQCEATAPEYKIVTYTGSPPDWCPLEDT